MKTTPAKETYRCDQFKRCGFISFDASSFNWFLISFLLVTLWKNVAILLENSTVCCGCGRGCSYYDVIQGCTEGSDYSSLY